MTDRSAQGPLPPRPRRRTPADPGRAEPRLTRAEIVRAALRLLAEQGYETFSMRRLATVLEVKNPSLYWHVQHKEELFDLIADAVLGECPLPEPAEAGQAEDWAGKFAEIARGLRRAILDHAAAVPLLSGRPFLGPNGLRLADRVVGLLRGAGFDDRTAGYGYLLLLYYVIGFAGQETAFGPGETGEARLRSLHQALAELPAGAYPHLTALSTALTERGLDDRFELGLRGLLSGLAAELPGR
ncbi:TetR/AcrR family transcriptional regulator C-terminal domain-containing protein [Streptomyces orinoci]|uniref:TetR/AcrR family transcriptional regulator C-terminal domain-containing protein n=1 Tax=Streptomyces orinoci TaxID=67339 RepID=A0ABV3JUP4_STRON|nr:TetR/AcrR family transcriptional regulator C-terminal domain-containing protein [Streptomyces orinoci]